MPLRATSIHGVSIPCLVPLTAGGTRPPIILADSSIVIGSGDAAQIRLKSLSVSKAHALVLVDDAKVYVRDLASRTELFVNDVAVREAWLKHGDVVRVGRFGFGVVEDAALQGRPAGSAAPAMVLRVEGEAADRRVTEPVMLIGRRSKCDITVSDEGLSGSHAILFRIGARWYLRDLSSRTGTFVNGTPVRQQRALAEGDLIRAGRTEMRFLGEEQQAAGAPRMADHVARGPVEPARDVPVAAAATPAEPIGVRERMAEAAKPVNTGVIAGEETVTAAATPERAYKEAPVVAPMGAQAGPLPTVETSVPPAARIEPPQETEPTPDVTSAPKLKTVAPEIRAPILATIPAAVAAAAATVPTAKSGDQAVPTVAFAASAAPVVPAVSPATPLARVADQAAIKPKPKADEAPKALPQTWMAGASTQVDDSAIGLEFHQAAGAPTEAGVVTAAAVARGGGRDEANPSGTEWEQAVTVWNFEDLARRSSGDRAEETEGAGQPLLWVAVAVGLACVGMMGVLAYKML